MSWSWRRYKCMAHTCPVCGEPAMARLHRNTAAEIGLSRLYRHRANGWVYLHRIEWGQRLPEGGDRGRV